MMKKIPCNLFLIRIIWIMVIGYFIWQKYHRDFLDAWIYSQYTTMNLSYQTWNFTQTFDERYIYSELGDFSHEYLKAPITCGQTWCFSPYTLQLKSNEWSFSISRILVYKTMNKEFENISGPYYFSHQNSIHIGKWEEVVLDQSVIYENLSWTDVSQFLPKKYGSFIFQDPIEIYYEIYPIEKIWTWAYATISLKNK